MKKILVSIFSLVLIMGLLSCSEETEPQFRVHNERTGKTNLQIQTTGGNTININDVNENQTTEYQTAAEGEIIATAVIQGENISPTITFFAQKDQRYTIVIQNGIIPTLRVDH